MSCVQPLKGAGELFVMDRASANNYATFSFGNATDWSIDGETADESLPDYTTDSFAPCATDETLSSLTFSGRGFEFKPSNTVLLLQGRSTTEAAAAVAAKGHVAWQGGFVEFSPLPDASATLVVTDIGATTTYTEGVDYRRTRTGIYIYSSGSIAQAADNVTNNIEVTYTGLATSTVQALTDFGTKEYTLIFDMKNTGAGGVPARTKVHRVKWRIFTAFPLMGETFQEFPLSASILADPLITSSALSPYFETVGVTPTEVV